MIFYLLKKSDKEIQAKIKDVRKKLLYSQLYYDNRKISGDLTDEFKTKYNNDFKVLQHNIDLIEAYERRNIIAKEKFGYNCLS